MIPSMLPVFPIDFTAQDLYTALSCHKSPHYPTSLFMKYPFQLKCYTLSSKLIPFSCLSRHGIWPWGSEDLKKNLEKEHPIICHSVEEDEENKKSKLFFFVVVVHVHLRNWIKAEKGAKIWGRIKEGGRIKREGKLSHPRMRDPGEVQAGQPVTE